MLTQKPVTAPPHPAAAPPPTATDWPARAAAARRTLTLIFLAAAVLLPEFTLSSRLPNVRLEQLALPYGLLCLRIDHRRGQPLRPELIDWLFAALGISILLSILIPPLLLHTARSARDFYELLKPALYYVSYRLARSAFPGGRGGRSVLTVFLAAGSLSALFGVVQYAGLLRVNAWLTPHFAPAHHLRVLRESGRAVGTIGNPNYFGIVSAILAFAALLSFWLRVHAPALTPEREGGDTDASTGHERPPAWHRPPTLSADLGLLLCAALASLALVFSGSRTALLALAAGLAAILALALLRRRALGRLAGGCAVLLVLLVLALGVAERFPHGHIDYLGRLTEGLNLQEDASFGLRLARWRSFLDAWRPQRAASESDIHRLLTSVHATGAPPAPAAAQARDAQRKADVLSIARAIDSYHAHNGHWPDPTDLAHALVPAYLPALPADPASGQPYADIATVSGYSLMARLEDQSDPDYPIYGIGSSPNYLLNGDLEQGGERPVNWDAIPGTSFSLQGGDALYGEHAVLYRGNTRSLQQRGGIFQQRYFGRPGGNPFTASVWVRLLRPASGHLDLYANLIYTDGSRADPLTRIPVDMSRIGVWQKVSLGILPPAGQQFSFLGVYVVSGDFAGEALLDGFQLVDGPVPLSFALTREAPPSDTLGFNPEARLRRSPLLGVGPEKGAQGGSVDDEYLVIAARYGLLGIVIYLALYLGTLTLALRAYLRAREPAARTLAGLTAATFVALLIFNLTAGSFLELQLMAIVWLLAGVALASLDAVQ